MSYTHTSGTALYSYKQEVIAMGEGAKAALSAFDDRIRTQGWSMLPDTKKKETPPQLDTIQPRGSLSYCFYRREGGLPFR